MPTTPDDQNLVAPNEAPEAGVLRNSSWMLISQVSAVAITGAVTIAAVRVLSVTAWGHFTTALALIAIATVFASSGVATLALREMSNEISRQNSILGTGLVAIGTVAVVTAVVVVPLALAIGYSRDVVVLVALALPLIFLQPTLALLQASFNARHALYLAARFLILQTTVYGVGALAVLVLRLGAAGLIVVTIVSAVVGTIAGFVILRAQFGVRPQITMARHEVMAFIAAALPVAGIGIVSILYERLDVLMLSVLGGARDVARYSVAYNMIVVTAFVPAIVSAAFFPVLTRKIKAGTVSDARDTFFFVVRLFFALSIPLALVLAVSAPVLVPFVFGERYASSVHVLQILAATPVIAFQIYAFWYIIFAAHRERRVLAFQITGLLLNLGMNAVLIPIYGPAGAAWSWLAAETLVALLQAWLVHRLLFPIPFRDLLVRPAIAAFVVTPVAVLIGLWTPVIGAAVGAAACFAALLLSGYIRGEELEPLGRALRSGVWLVRRRGT